MHTKRLGDCYSSFLHFLYPQVNNKTQITGKFLERKQQQKLQKKKKGTEAGLMSYFIWILPEEML